MLIGELVSALVCEKISPLRTLLQYQRADEPSIHNTNDSVTFITYTVQPTLTFFTYLTDIYLHTSIHN